MRRDAIPLMRQETGRGGGGCHQSPSRFARIFVFWLGVVLFIALAPAFAHSDHPGEGAAQLGDPGAGARGKSQTAPADAHIRRAINLGLTAERRPAAAGAPSEPAAVARAYFEAFYANDHPAAYSLISENDRQHVSEKEYLSENDTFTGRALKVTRALTRHVSYRDLKTEVKGDRATVSFTATVPRASDPALSSGFLDYDEASLTALSPAEWKRLVARIDELGKERRLPLSERAETLELIRQGSHWRIFLNWAASVRVHFSAATMEGLPWEFLPAQPMVRVQPGQTFQTYYRARNLAGRKITGRALHSVAPKPAHPHLTMVECFCFNEQPLAPGEAAVLPVVFRVNGHMPKTIKDVAVFYEMYPIEKFPVRPVKEARRP